MYTCYHCGADAVVQDSDFTFEDYNYEGDGLVCVYHCNNCGAYIEYKIPMNDDTCEQHVFFFIVDDCAVYIIYVISLGTKNENAVTQLLQWIPHFWYLPVVIYYIL